MLYTIANEPIASFVLENAYFFAPFPLFLGIMVKLRFQTEGSKNWTIVCAFSKVIVLN